MQLHKVGTEMQREKPSVRTLPIYPVTPLKLLMLSELVSLNALLSTVLEIFNELGGGHKG